MHRLVLLYLGDVYSRKYVGITPQQIHLVFRDKQLIDLLCQTNGHDSLQAKTIIVIS